MPRNSKSRLPSVRPRSAKPAASSAASTARYARRRTAERRVSRFALPTSNAATTVCDETGPGRKRWPTKARARPAS
eukprot:11184911-Lingulodinium_polyedra.AAC.1